MKFVKRMGCLTLVNIGSCQQVMGKHALIGCSVTIKIVGQDESQTIIREQRVCLIACLQVGKFASHSTHIATSRHYQHGQQQGNEKRARMMFHGERRKEMANNGLVGHL
jgi:hypothetical protein